MLVTVMAVFLRAVFVQLNMQSTLSVGLPLETVGEEKKEKEAFLEELGFSEEVLDRCAPQMIDECYEKYRQADCTVLFSRQADSYVRRTIQQRSEPDPEVFVTCVWCTDPGESAVPHIELYVNYQWEQPPLLWGQDSITVCWDPQELAPMTSKNNWLQSRSFGAVASDAVPVFECGEEIAEVDRGAVSFPVVLKGCGLMRTKLNGYACLFLVPLRRTSNEITGQKDVSLRAVYSRRSLMLPAAREFSLFQGGRSSTSAFRLYERYFLIGVALTAAVLFVRVKKDPPRSGQSDTDESSPEEMVMSEFARSCMDYLVACVEKPCSISSLAAAVGYSDSRTRKRFREEFGRGAMEVLQELRMERAKEYLKKTDWSIDIISERLQFSSSSYFGRVFRKYAHMTPMEYRNYIRRGGST